MDQTNIIYSFFRFHKSFFYVGLCFILICEGNIVFGQVKIEEEIEIRPGINAEMQYMKKQVDQFVWGQRPRVGKSNRSPTHGLH